MKYRTLEISKRLVKFNGDLKEFNCIGILCLDCPFHIKNSYSYCQDFNETDLRLLANIYLSLPLKEELNNE